MWADTYVEFRGVSKSYDGRTLVLRDLDCIIRKGEFLTFLGPSGSGKTTALMLLAGFEGATAGDILMNGRSLGRTPSHRRNMGVVFQNYALFPHMTVAENIAFPLTVRRAWRGDVRDKVARALAMVRLEGLGERRPAQLSGGQQQRVALARALVFDPAIVLMDEPLGALDRQLREQLQLEIKQIQKDLGLTVVYVTHDQSEALTMSDRIAVFHGGRIAQIGAPEELYDRPATEFVARSLGETNRLVGEVIACDGDACAVVLADGSVVRAARAAGLDKGAAAFISVRPECVVLKPARGAGLVNLFEARVEGLTYHGDHTRVALRLGGGDQIIARDPGHAAGVGSGQVIGIGWAAPDCRAFPAVAEAPANRSDDP